ncbi:endonuclease/exonuclease/phosphatase family protein [Geodermatophilus sp. SYSU D00815]
MRVVTLNVFGRGPDWPRRGRLLAEGLGELAPDVVTLQEVVVGDGRDQAREVLGDGWHLTHRQAWADGRRMTTASRWPVGEVVDVGLPAGSGAPDFVATTFVTELLAPAPVGRVWLAHHLPDWHLDQESARVRQTRRAAGALEELVAGRPGHVVVAGDLDADPDADSIRFWTGRHVVDGLSVCYRDAWAGVHPGEPGHTFVPENPYVADQDWPYRRIDYVLVRCGLHGGPTLRITDCRRVFATPDTAASDHYGVLADLEPPPPH